MTKPRIRIYFSDFFQVSQESLDDYGAFNVSLITDLPLFIDPFLLFSSEKNEYTRLHAEIIEYVKYLKSQSSAKLDKGRIETLFYFKEVKQNWLGYSKSGNSGRGLGAKFATSLKKNLTTVFKDFGDESEVGTHLEKLTLVESGVGRDSVSDLTCNLIKRFLCEYTQDFAKKHVNKNFLKKFTIQKARFDKKTKIWMPATFELPSYNGDFVLLTPIDILTKDSAWINQNDFVEDFSRVIESVSNNALRANVSQYLASVLPSDPNKGEYEIAVEKVVKKYPELLNFFIAIKEAEKGKAALESAERIANAQKAFVAQLQTFVDILHKNTNFYDITSNSNIEALNRIHHLKQVIENQDGYRLFFIDGKPVRRESDLQIMFKLTWYASAFDSNAEVNNGRGPADFVISYGSGDKSVVEFKLASNTSLEKNLINQAEIYADAARATHPPIKAIMHFSETERAKVLNLLKKHKLENKKEIVLIDARPDKPSASKAKGATVKGAAAGRKKK